MNIIYEKSISCTFDIFDLMDGRIYNNMISAADKFYFIALVYIAAISKTLQKIHLVFWTINQKNLNQYTAYYILHIN